MIGFFFSFEMLGLKPAAPQHGWPSCTHSCCPGPSSPQHGDTGILMSPPPSVSVWQGGRGTLQDRAVILPFQSFIFSTASLFSSLFCGKNVTFSEWPDSISSVLLKCLQPTLLHALEQRTGSQQDGTLFSMAILHCPQERMFRTEHTLTCCTYIILPPPHPWGAALVSKTGEEWKKKRYGKISKPSCHPAPK